MAKTDYLYAFEALFHQKCHKAQIDPARWAQGMWANAHMHYGGGLTVEQGVEKWFAHVKKFDKAGG